MIFPSDVSLPEGRVTHQPGYSERLRSDHLPRPPAFAPQLDLWRWVYPIQSQTQSEQKPRMTGTMVYVKDIQWKQWRGYDSFDGVWYFLECRELLEAIYHNYTDWKSKWWHSNKTWPLAKYSILKGICFQQFTHPKGGYVWLVMIAAPVDIYSRFASRRFIEMQTAHILRSIVISGTQLHGILFILYFDVSTGWDTYQNPIMLLQGSKEV